MAANSLRFREDERVVPAHTARRPGRRRGGQPPAARAGGLHTEGRGGHLRLAPARPSRPAQARTDRPGGDGRGGRARAAAPDHPAARAVGANRARQGVRAADVPAGGSQGDGLLPVADGRRSDHDPRRAGVRLVPRPAGQPLPDQLEVSRRAATAVRLAARARVPDEGRVLVRPRSRRARAALPRDVRRVLPGVRAVWADLPRGRGAVGRDGRLGQPRVHGGRRRR